MVVLVFALTATFAPTAAFAAPNKSLANPAQLTGRMPQRHQPDRRPDRQPDHGMRCQTTYRVRKGDNLTRIARHFGVSVRSLVQANNIRNANRIFAGQVLCIP